MTRTLSGHLHPLSSRGWSTCLRRAPSVAKKLSTSISYAHLMLLFLINLTGRQDLDSTVQGSLREEGGCQDILVPALAENDRALQAGTAPLHSHSPGKKRNKPKGLTFYEWIRTSYVGINDWYNTVEKGIKKDFDTSSKRAIIDRERIRERARS